MTAEPHIYSTVHSLRISLVSFRFSSMDFNLFGIAVILLIPSSFSLERRVEVDSNPHKADVERSADTVGFEAIARLHKEMDDDLSGSVDMTESIDFVQEELDIQEKDKVAKRQEAFHLDDQQISVEDLWGRWVASPERNWTVADTLNWLVNVAELPEYSSLFEKNFVNGRSLPRIADPNGSFILSVLGISNPIHRHKLQLKALDVVLFGYKAPQISYTKDLVLVTLLVAAISAYYLTASKSKKTKSELQSLAKHMEYLKSMEQEFVAVQQKLEEERSRQHELQKTAVHHENENKEQIECLKSQLLVAEKQLEVKGGCAPLILQPLLKKTYECEMARINAEKKESLSEMQETKDMVEKLRRKQTSLVNQFRVAHLGSDELDQRMAHLRSRIHQTAATMEECQFRWSHIERICGFNIMSNSPTPSAISRPSLMSPVNCIDDYEVPPAYPYAAAVIPNLHHPAYLSHMMPIRSAANLQLRSSLLEELHYVPHSTLPSPQKGQPVFGLHDDEFSNSQDNPNLSEMATKLSHTDRVTMLAELDRLKVDEVMMRRSLHTLKMRLNKLQVEQLQLLAPMTKQEVVDIDVNFTTRVKHMKMELDDPDYTNGPGMNTTATVVAKEEYIHSEIHFKIEQL